MSFGIAFLLIAQSAAPLATRPAPTARPIASVSARVEVLRPVTIRVRANDGVRNIATRSDIVPQRRRDQAGTVWIEFN